MRRWIALLVVLAFPATAAGMPASADVLEASGAVDVPSDATGFTLTGDTGELDRLKIFAKSGYILHWTEAGVAGPDITGYQFGQGLPAEKERYPEDPETSFKNLQLQGGDQGANHLLNIIAFTDYGLANVHFTGDAAVGDAPSVSLEQEDGLCLSAQGMGQTLCRGFREADSSPTEVPMPSPSLLVTAQEGGNFKITGDFLVVDVQGIDLDGDVKIPGRPQVSDLGGTYETYFSRLVLEDARIQFHVDGAHEQVAWAAESVALEIDGDLGITGGSGSLDIGGETVPLDGKETFTGRMMLNAEPGPANMQFAAHEDPVAPATASETMPLGFSWTLAGLVSLLPLVGVGMTVRRTQAHATMRDVESALGSGAFRKAARVAGRIIRQDPTDESAHLGRAIALTKSGRAAHAVAGLDDLLQHHRPSDGTLHYTLGVALNELGRHEEARAAMARAVERTPELAEGMDASIRPRYVDGAYS